MKNLRADAGPLVLPVNSVAGRAGVDLEVTILARVTDAGPQSRGDPAIIASRVVLDLYAIAGFHGRPLSSLASGSARLSQPSAPEKSLPVVGKNCRKMAQPEITCDRSAEIERPRCGLNDGMNCNGLISGRGGQPLARHSCRQIAAARPSGSAGPKGRPPRQLYSGGRNSRDPIHRSMCSSSRGNGSCVLRPMNVSADGPPCNSSRALRTSLRMCAANFESN